MTSSTPHTNTTFLVQKTQLQRSEIRALPIQALTDGQVRLSVDSFALTSNNMTYAAFGEAMNYWGFYPADDPQWGIIPVWGFATVVESKNPALPLGERFYGYYPMAQSVVLSADRVNSRGFFDAAPHRSALNAVYNQYHRCSADAFHLPAQPAAEALLRPLFLTSWLIDDFLADNDFYGAQRVILSSASSKTAYGTAHQLKQRGALEVVGLSSAANVAFCESLGCYDRVLAYELLADIAADAPCVYVDFAGNAALRLAIHTRFTELKYSCSVGGTHITELGGAKGLPGPRPILFFAPAQSQKRAAEWGAAQFGRRIVAGWQDFVKHASSAQPAWLVPQLHSGEAAVSEMYAAILAGKTDPRSGHILSLNAAKA